MSPKPEFRRIEDLRSIHKGKEIWILGTGWSLDEFPDNFFKDKLAIAHRASSIAFPYCSYACTGSGGTKIGKFLQFQGKAGFKKIIVCLSKGQRPSRLKWLGTNWRDPIYLFGMEKKGPLFDRKSKEREEFKDMVAKMAESIIKGKYFLYVCWAVSLHFSIEAAIIMGASKVTLAGASCGATKWKIQAQNRGLSSVYPENPPPEGYSLPWSWEEPCNFGTNVLAQVFEPYKVFIRRYFYGKGYEQIPAPVEFKKKGS